MQLQGEVNSFSNRWKKRKNLNPSNKNTPTMNSRKANLRKLRLPSTETKANARNGFQKTTNPISNCFPTDIASTDDEDEGDQHLTTNGTELMPSPIPYGSPMPSPIEAPKDDPPDDKATRSKTRLKLKTFLPMEKRLKPSTSADENPQSGFLRKFNDFETAAKSVKPAPKTKKAKSSAKPKTKKPSKKQPTIKSAFFQNEELFSDVAAQHCLVDNVNPEEMQLALALSRSEVELSGATTSQEKSADSNQGIRDKLKKFGFRVAESEEINYATAFKVTKGKSKWANKFTPLTLRNSKNQAEKLQKRIEEILTLNSSPEPTANEEEIVHAYSLESSALLPYAAENRIIETDSSKRSELVDFYVLSLFEVSKTKPGHLLKDVRRIPGRDRSPEIMKSSNKKDDEVQWNDPLENIKSSPSTDDAVHQVDVRDNEVLQTIQSPTKSVGPMHEIDFQRSGSPLDSRDFIKGEIDPRLQSPAIKKSKADEEVEVDTKSNECSQLSLPSTIAPDESIQRRRKTPSLTNLQRMTTDLNLGIGGIESSQASSETYPSGLDIGFQVQLRPMRATSPDIFADSDVDMESDEGSKTETPKFTAIQENIETFELYSSDEVKTLSGSKIDACDRNHNSLPLTFDLTQQDSSCSPVSIHLIPPSEPVEPLPCFSELPRSSFYSDPNDITLKFTEPRRKTNSFGSSLSKSFSFEKSKDGENLIDLTQSDIDADTEEDIDCIVLSDDEVNYSIRKADKSLLFKDENISPDSSVESIAIEKQEFSFIDLVTATQPLAPTQSEDFDFDFGEKSPDKSLHLSKVSEFGILEEQSPFKTPTKTPKKTPRKSTPPKSPKVTCTSPSTSKVKCRRTLSESFLCSPLENSAPLKRFSSSNKFKEFAKSDEDGFSDLDDIDKLIYGSPTKKVYKKPTGLTQLLTGPINDKLVSPEKPVRDEPQEFNFNGRTYLVRMVDAATRPNFATMDESALLDRLYQYGIKPLKRKQAEKILEYIYNQTHPRLVDEGELPSTATSDVLPDDGDAIDSDDCDDMSKSSSKFHFKDCWGHVLVPDDVPSMEIKDEQYFFQTNTSKKISTAALPLHIAWYNLIRSNTQLNEAILFYEPIDLQEVYLFLKSIGYRYNPKDLKYFFDSRSIIFRYDVKKSESSGSNRHVRKKKRQKVK